MPSHVTGLFDLFVSYSNKDNVIPPGEREGWVQVFVSRIRELAKGYTQQNLTTIEDASAGFDADYRTFFDKDSIHAGQDWETRLLSAVSHTRVLLACLSPHYWESKWCQREWEAYLANEEARGLAHMEGGITPIYIATESGINTQTIVDAAPDWAKALLRTRQVRLLPFEMCVLDALSRLKALHDDPVAAKTLDSIAARISGQIKHARRAECIKQGNIATGTDTFVGRKDELTHVERELFGGGALGVITALQGIGGQGKTALALRYGHNLRSRYTGGCWQIMAEGEEELVPLLATLREPLKLPAIATDTETDTAERVLTELHKRAHQTEHEREASDYAAALLVVDNVDHAALLGQTQRDALRQAMNRAGLPGDPGWMHLLATTRLEPEELSFLPREKIIAIDALPMPDALALWRRIQEEPGKALPPEELTAAEQIITLLARHTLAVEVAARHIRRTWGENSRSYLARLQQSLTSPGQIAAKISADQRRIQGAHLTIANPIATTLGFTFGHLARDEEGGPAALTVLHYAAHFPPEAVPLPWLRQLAGKHHPELLAKSEAPGIPTAWDRAELRLTESLRLLSHVDDEAPEIAKMHRLAGDFLRAAAAKAKEDDGRRIEVEELIGRRLSTVEADHFTAFTEWERTFLTADLASRSSKADCSAQIAHATVCFAQLLPAFGEEETAIRLLTRSESVLRSHVSIASADQRLKVSLAICLEHLGDIALSRNQLDLASSKFDECLSIAKELLADDPDNHDKLHYMSVYFEKKGKIFAQQDDHEFALTWFTMSWKVRQRLTSSDPKNLLWCRDLSISMEKIAECNVELGILYNARNWLRQCRDLREQLVQTGYTDPAWVRDLGVICAKQGDVAMRLGNYVEARDLFLESYERANKLSMTDSSNIVWRWDVATTASSLAMAREKLGDWNEAIDAHVDAATIAHNMVTKYSEGSRYLSTAVHIHMRFGRLVGQLGLNDVAVHQFTTSLRLLEDMKGRGIVLDKGMEDNLCLLREMFDQLDGK